MADGVLKSFLVDLGFRVDEPGLNRFRDQLTRTHHVVRDFTVGFAALAGSVEEAIRRTAKKFEDLYYLSQQTRTSATVLRGVQSAFEEIGLTAGEASSTLAGMASSWRDNPGLRFFVQQFAPGVRNGAEALSALATRYRNIIQQFGEFSAQEAQFRAVLRAMGQDPDVILRSAQNQDKYNDRIAFTRSLLIRFGIDADDAAGRAVGVARGWSRVWETVTTAFQKFSIVTFPYVKVLLDDFANWMSKEGADAVSAWARRLDKLVSNPENIKATENAFKKIGDAVSDIVTGLGNWIDKEDGLNKTGAALRSIADAVQSIGNVMKWMADHPTIAGMIFGGIVGARTAGPVGAVVGAVGGATAGNILGSTQEQTDYNQALKQFMRDKSLGRDPRSFDQFLSDLRSQNEAIRRWLDGVKNTPWVKVENTNEPLVVNFAAGVYGQLTNAFRLLLGLPTTGPPVPGETSAGAAGAVPPVVGASRSPPIGHEREFMPEPGRGRFGTVPRPRPHAQPGAGGVPHLPGSVYEAISQAEGTFEGGQINYNEVLGKGRYGRPDRPLTEMSLSEAYQFGRQVLHRHGSSSAIGAFQIVGRTMMDAVKALGLSMTEKFSPENQRRMADWIFKTQGSRAWEGFISHPNLRRIAESMAHHASAMDVSGHRLGSERPARNVNIDSDHRVEINVHGANDPHGTARAVRDSEDRHSMLHARNLRTAVA
jgi:hypothetical protein